MKSIFKDRKVQQQFDRDGYIVLPFLTNDAISSLKNLYETLHPTGVEQGFYSSTFSMDEAYKDRIFKLVDSLYAERVAENFEDVKKLGASFLVKQPGENGRMPIHQDWTVVDESKFGSLTIWIPLENVSAQNGAIRVLPGSHRFSNTLRGPTLPTVLDEIEPLIDVSMLTLEMKAGEAFIFDHGLIHASHLNQSEQPRIAVTYGLIPAEAQLFYYFKDTSISDSKIEKFQMPLDFFCKYHNIGQRPEIGESLGFIEADFEQITTQEFKYFLNDFRDLSLLNKINKKMIRPLFLDPVLQQQFEEKGWVKVPMLDLTEVADLLNFYGELDKSHIPDYGFHVSLDNRGVGYAAKVIDKLNQVITPKANKFLERHKVFTGSFVVKEANKPSGIVPPHQDWTFVDENKYASATFWVALVDTNMDNGALGVIEGSNNFFDHPRASPAPEFKAPFDAHMFSIFPYLKLIPMKAGEALIFNNATMHASPPNTTDQARIAAAIGVCHEEAQLYHYFLEPAVEKHRLMKYKFNESLFPLFNNGYLGELYRAGKKPEQGEFVGFVPYNPDPCDLDWLLGKIKAEGNNIDMPLIEKLAKLFSYNLDGSKKESSEKSPEGIEAIEAEETHRKEEEMRKEEAERKVQGEMTAGKGNGTNGSKEHPVHSEEWLDPRSFFEKYSPGNVVREVVFRLKKMF